MAIQRNFKRQLRRIRKSKELTQEQLAARANRSVEAISNLERGLNLPSFETLEELAAALQVPARDFFEFDDEDAARATKLADLLNIARTLSDEDLSVAVIQVRALRDKGQ